MKILPQITILPNASLPLTPLCAVGKLVDAVVCYLPFSAFAALIAVVSGRRGSTDHINEFTVEAAHIFALPARI